MNDLEYVIEMLKTSNKAAVAKAVGLSARTVRDIAKGNQQQPSYKTVASLVAHFKGEKK